MSETSSRLGAAGLSQAEAAAKSILFETAERKLGRPAERRWFIPGRIEVFGKHTDYCGGPSLVCACERGFCVVAANRNDSIVHVCDALADATVTFPLSPDIQIPTGWANYVATVVRRVASNFPGAKCGVDIVFASDLPQSAGLSSSSALIIAIFTAISSANHFEECAAFSEIASVPEQLAAYLGCIENGQPYRAFAGDIGVGTFGGSEDHTAIVCCETGHINQYRFAPTSLVERVRMPEEWIFAIANSGVAAEKTGAARDRYNRISTAARAVLDTWNRASESNYVSLASAISQSPNAVDDIRKALRTVQSAAFSTEELLRRFDHFALEFELVPAAARAFAARDTAGLADIAGRSQSAAAQLLRNQIPETAALTAAARDCGAFAASAFGAGFGGSVWGLVLRSDAQRLIELWRTTYEQRFSALAQHSNFFTTAPGPGLTAI